MPDPRSGESRSDFVSRCILLVLDEGVENNPNPTQDQAVAICNQMWRDRARSLVMKVTKVQLLQNGRVRWQARANTGEYDLLQERFDQHFFDDVIANFYRTKEALSKGLSPPDGMTEPILDIAHYSIYLPAAKRNLARAGWIDKMWRDGRVLFSQGFFDDTRLGQLAAKAASERKPEDRRVSIVVYPDYSLVETETGGRKTYRGGNGKAWMDSLAMTSTPCDPGAVMEVRSMTTIKEDAQKVLGDDGDEIVAELEEARAAKALPDGVLVKSNDDRPEELKAVWTRAFINDLPDSSFLYIESGGEKDEEGKTTPRSLRHFPVKDAEGKVDLPHLRNAIARIPQSNAEGLNKEALQNKARRMLEAAQKEKVMPDEETIKTEETPTEETPAVEPLTMEGLQAALDTILPGIAGAIDERMQPLQQQVAELAGKTAEFEAQIKTLVEDDTTKIKAALDGDGDWFARMWGNSVQRSDAVKGEVEIKKPKQVQDSDFARLFGEPES